MSKFKVGDKILCIEPNCGCSASRAPDTVKRIDVDGTLVTDAMRNFLPSQVKLVTKEETKVSKFKAGDRVVCVEGTGASLMTGSTYVVEKCYRDDEQSEEMVNLEGGKKGWYAYRFKLVSTETTSQKMTLPTDSAKRKEIPMLRGCLKYFPAALAGVANTSKQGNDKHNPNEEMHHARGKSSDQGDCIVRHLLDVEDLLAALSRGDTTVTPEAILTEVNQMAWRALALSQELHEKFGAPLAPAAKLPGGSNAKGR